MMKALLIGGNSLHSYFSRPPGKKEAIVRPQFSFDLYSHAQPTRPLIQLRLLDLHHWLLRTPHMAISVSKQFRLFADAAFLCFMACAWSHKCYSSFEVDCCWLSLTLRLDRFGRTQFLGGSSDCDVSWCLVVRCSISIRAQEQAKSWWLEHCVILCCRSPNLARESSASTL